MSNDVEESSLDDDLRSEYDFSSMKSKPNRFSGQKPDTFRYVPLDPDVSAFYADTKELNDLLRSMIPILAKNAKVAQPLEPAKI